MTQCARLGKKFVDTGCGNGMAVYTGEENERIVYRCGGGMLVDVGYEGRRVIDRGCREDRSRVTNTKCD